MAFSFLRGRILRLDTGVRRLLWACFLILFLSFACLQIVLYTIPTRHFLYVDVDSKEDNLAYLKSDRTAGKDAPFLQKNTHLRKKKPVTDSPEKPFQECHFQISVQTPGRLGNLMFAYASMLGIARTVNRTPVISRSNPLLSFFKLTTSISDSEGYNWTKFEPRWSAAYDASSAHIPCNDDVMLVGHFQSWRYFKNIENTIRNEFIFKNPIQRAAVQFLRRSLRDSYGKNITRNDVVIVGVHVRRSDMTDFENRQRGYVVASRQYIQSSMAFLEAQYHHILFVVCSDDLFWSEQNVNSAKFPVVYSDNYHAIVDLAILSLCDHVIMTVGSYGWWGAYLAGGTTIYMSDFPRKRSTIAQEYNRKDYFYPGWRGIPSK